MDTPVQEALSADIHLLGDLLGDVIRRLAGPAAFALEEELRAAAKALRANPSLDGARRLRARLEPLDVPALVTLGRSFSVYFDLVNLAEQQARVRAIRQRTAKMAPRPIPESPEDALRQLSDRGVTAAEVTEHLAVALVCPVFTAHPSEARRRTVLEKLQTIARHLDRLEYARLLPRERDRAVGQIAAEIEIYWQTDFVRIARPTVLDEVRQCLEVVESSLFQVVPRIYRDLETALRKTYPDRAWHVPPFLRFGSWIGGDRDGHPDVTHTVTAEAVRLQQQTIIRHYQQRVEELGRQLSHSDQFVSPGPEFVESVRRDEEIFPDAAGPRTHEPFRRKLRLIGAKLARTLRWVDGINPRWGEDVAAPAGVYRGHDGLLQDLSLIGEELKRCGTAAAGSGVNDLIRLVEVFGLHLLKLDIRQHSGLHAQTVGEAFRAAGVCPNYTDLSPDARFDVLAQELAQSRPLLTVRPRFSAPSAEVIATFRTVAALLEQQCPAAIDTWIISSTTEPAHLLEVLLLAREAGLFRPDEGVSRLHIVPLFEALEPLRTAVAIMERLFALPAYRRHLALRGNLQEVMIGYSDSNKESGFLQSAWALYRVQLALVELGKRVGITIQFFHGRGGAIGRGGGPANRAVLAQPPGTVDGRLRNTEQGEMVADRYGHPSVAERHLGQVLNAVLQTSFAAGAKPADPAWEPMLDRLADAACAAYRALVYENPEFLTYFEQATPLREITQLKIGSRPARRSAAASVEQLRAIPWVFSWMQSRHTLPGWYGLGSAVSALLAEAPGQLRVLQDMYERWPFWRTVIDNAQMILAKADLTIARLYADLVEDQALAGRVYDQIAAEHRRTVDVICRVTGQRVLLEQTPVLQHSIQQRNPYVDPLSFIQLVLLKRLRGSAEPREDLLKAVLESINGVAAGLKNTG